MIFSSPEFIFIFLPIVLLGFAASEKLPWQRASLFWLVASSLFFYGWWNPRYLILIVALILANFWLGRLIANAGTQSLRKIYLIIGLVLNLGTLIYYKYANFFLENVNAVAGTEFDLGKIILPLGISFFTFQKIAFLVDTYHGRVKHITLADFSLFVLFFPQLIAGPIVHHAEIVPQFKVLQAKSINWDNITVGICVFAIGLFKKIVLADSLSAYAVTPVFGAAEAGQSLSFLAAWGGVLGYTLQLYFDFSGYTDMAIGAARMFGIRLPENFNSPYKSANIIDFWRRWHITLGRFLRDYLYIALGGNRRGEVRRYINLFLTMLLGGVWHGAGWTFVVWGALHGFYLTVNHAWRALTKHVALLGSLGDHRVAKIFSVGITFLAVVVAWVFFRAENFHSAISVLRSMFGANGVVLPDFVPLSGQLADLGFTIGTKGEAFGPIQSPVTFLSIGLLLLWCWMLPNAQQIFHQHNIALSSDQKTPPPALLVFRQNWWWSAAAAVTIVICLLVLQTNIAQEFLYFDF